MLAFAVLLLCCVWSASTFGQILFDNTKAETAGNADWIIDTHQPIPSPTITNITSGTAENYWIGALSSWGVALAKLRNTGQITLGTDGLETLPSGGRITYGDGSNAQDLSHYQVYVVCEPNILFTATEKTAIVNFVKNGGGLFMVADHTGSDRNNDGSDSLMVWNDLMSNNTVQVNPFGFAYNSVDVSPSGPTADTSPTNPMTHGIAGTVTTLTYSSGTTMTINNSNTTHPAVWSASSTTGVMALYGTFGSGRFAAIGDSSVVEDVTSSGGTTYAGWTTPVDNGYCALNGTVWLLGGGTNASTPTVITGTASGIGTTNATLNGTVNPNNQSTTAQFQYGLTTNYGTTVSLSGTLTGTSAQAISTNITGLTLNTTYHFCVVATNASGQTVGSDQTFTTASSPVVDLAITKTHSGSFTQGDASDTYTITVTNIGTAASSGTVTVVDSLPAGFTAIAISGTGWTTNLGTLTCTRSDALGAGTAYPPILVTVSVATNAPASLTNFATVSGGGDTNTVNNTSSDITAINASSSSGGTNFTGVLAGWDVSGQTNFGVSPLAPTTNAANVTVGSLTRGTGVLTPSGAAGKAWGGTSWNSTSEAAAISANEFATFSLTAKTGYKVSFTSVNEFDYRRSGTGPPNGELQYQIGTGSFADIIALSYASTPGGLGPIDLSGISALQNVGAGTNVTFRIVNWGASGSGGTWYILDVNNSTASDLAISGTLVPIVSLTPVETWRLQWFGVTNNSGNAADSFIGTTDGLPNLVKYALGLNPLTVTNSAAFSDLTTGYLRLTVPKNQNATDIIFSTQLTGNVAGPWTTNGIIIDQNTSNLFQAHDNVPVSAASGRFIRLQVTRP